MDGAGFTVTVADAETLLFATLVAVTLTLSSEETLGGALYVAAVLEAWVKLPQELPLQPVPVILQDTPFPLESLETLAVKFTVCPVSICCWMSGEMVTEICGVAVFDATGVLEPPPQLANRNTTTVRIPTAFFTVTCPLPFSKPFVCSLAVVKAAYLYTQFTVNGIQPPITQLADK